MPKRGAKPSSTFSTTILLAVAALVLFVGGEALIPPRTASGRRGAARYFHAGDEADVREIVARQIRRGLDDAGVPRDSVRDNVRTAGASRAHWRVGLPPRTSTLQVNYAITRALETQGAVVLSGREAPGPHGELFVTLVLGLPGRPMHEALLVRPGRAAGARSESQSPGRLALVLYGLGDDLTHVSPLAWRRGVASAQPDFVLEAGRRGDTQGVDQGWRLGLGLARRRGSAIVMLRADDAALGWLPGAVSARRLGGVEIVPLAALLRRP